MTTELEPGSLLRGKYRVVRLLGQGGMGRVIEALHLDLDRRVAVKVLHPELRANRELVDRFLREGRAASKIEGEHVARVLDVDRLDDGTPFLVMEYLEGQDLSLVRRSKSPLAAAIAIDYVLQACTAIREAHERGIIHRDIKPANLFLTRSRSGQACIKVLDFGISKVSGALDGSEPSLTKTSLVMGSAEFMSPEQMLSTRTVDARTDIWALGVVLYELLTALPPFVGENMTQVCAMVMSQSPPPPRSIRPEIPEALERVVLRCLEKNREARYPSVEAFTSALVQARDGHPELPAPRTSQLATPRMARSDAPPGPFVPMASTPGTDPATSILPDTDPKLRALAEAAQQQQSVSPARGPAPLAHATALSASPSSGSLTSVPVSSEAVPQPPRNSSALRPLAIGAALLALGAGGILLASGRLKQATGDAKPSSANSLFEPASTTQTPVSATAQATSSHSLTEPRPSSTVVVEPATPTAAEASATVASASARPTSQPAQGAPSSPASPAKPKKPPKPVASPKKTSGID